MLETPAQVFSYEISEILKKTFELLLLQVVSNNFQTPIVKVAVTEGSCNSILKTRFSFSV